MIYHDLPIKMVISQFATLDNQRIIASLNQKILVKLLVDICQAELLVDLGKL